MNGVGDSVFMDTNILVYAAFTRSASIQVSHRDR